MMLGRLIITTAATLLLVGLSASCDRLPGKPDEAARWHLAELNPASCVIVTLVVERLGTETAVPPIRLGTLSPPGD